MFILICTRTHAHARTLAHSQTNTHTHTHAYIHLLTRWIYASIGIFCSFSLPLICTHSSLCSFSHSRCRTRPTHVWKVFSFILLFFLADKYTREEGKDTLTLTSTLVIEMGPQLADWPTEFSSLFFIYTLMKWSNRLNGDHKPTYW